jgi:hypothetical protein
VFYALATTQATTLTSNLTATALLTPSLKSSLSYLNSRESIQQNKNSFDTMPFICAFTEDYRSSTVFDALGSIGGLLALLQGMHILLFGRPMFWGIAGEQCVTFTARLSLTITLVMATIGSKLINPFGLLGRCHSRGFRRRLREQYHYPPAGQPEDDAVKAIRISAFLRDFVIDFGPADVDDAEEPVEERGGSKKPRSETGDDESSRGHDAL